LFSLVVSRIPPRCAVFFSRLAHFPGPSRLSKAAAVALSLPRVEAPMSVLPTVVPPTIGTTLLPAQAALLQQRPKVLVVGDENLLFSSGLQQAYPGKEFTVATPLSRQNLELYKFDANPGVLQGRVRHMVDASKIGKHFPGGYDELLCLLPGLGFQVPAELGQAGRPLFAFRTHLFLFHIVRHAKFLLKGTGKFHIVWPDQTGLMTSPCGAAGIDVSGLAAFCGMTPLDAPCYEMEKISAAHFRPFLFGHVPAEQPSWLRGTTVLSYSLGKENIKIPFAAALLLHPDTGFVEIKDASEEMPGIPPKKSGMSLRAALGREAMIRKERLKEIYGPKKGDAVDAFGLVAEPPEEDTCLSIPMEIFCISLDELPHVNQLLRFQVLTDQPPVSVCSLDLLDPRLPGRIARPPQPKGGSQLAGGAVASNKRMRCNHEEWGGMRFYCSLTKIYTMTADKMRQHMQGQYYSKLAATATGWSDSTDKRELVAMLEEEESEKEKEKRAKKNGGGTVVPPPPIAAGR